MLTARPADYDSQEEVIQDSESGKDFLLEPSGKYINKSDAEKYGIPENQIKIRYARLRKLVIIKVEKQP